MQWRRVDVGIEAVTPDANLLEAQNVCFGEMDLNTGSRVRWLKILHCPGRYLFFSSASGKTVTPLSMSDLFFSSASHDYPKATV